MHSLIRSRSPIGFDGIGVEPVGCGEVRTAPCQGRPHALGKRCVSFVTAPGLTAADIARTYHAWRGEAKDGDYEDKPGFCKAATLDEIKANDYVLTPGRYVGAAEIEDDGIPFEQKMTELSQTLYRQMDEAERLDAEIRKNLEGLGYGG